MGGNKVSASGTAAEATEAVTGIAGAAPTAGGTAPGTAGVVPGDAAVPHHPATPPARRRRWTLLAVLRSVALWRLLLLVAILAVWEWSSDRLIRAVFISRPSDVVVRLWDLLATGEIWPHVWKTYTAVGIGYFSAAAVGIVLGIVLGRSSFLASLLEPFIMAIYSVPKVALAPLFILWLGIGLSAKVAIAFISAFFLVFFNTFAGLRSVNEEHVNLARVMGASRFDVNRLVVLPSTMPYIMVGLKTALPFAVIGAVVGEFMASNQGLGFFILYSGNTLDSAGLFAGLIILVTGVALANGVVRTIERRIIRWHPSQLTQSSRTVQ